MNWNCPVCSSETARLFVIRNEWWVRGCSICEHHFVEFNPDPQHASAVYGDGYFFGGAGGYPDYLSEGDILRRQGMRYARILSKYTQPGSVLDVGAAAGFISDGYRALGWIPEDLDPNERMTEYARTKLSLAAYTGTLESFQSSKIYDVISMIQVVQHLTDPCRAMSIAAGLTRPGGFWLIETWNNRSISARLLRSRWHVYNPPSVLQFFSTKSLEVACRQFGMCKVAAGRPAKRISAGHAKSLLEYHLGNGTFARALRLVPDRISIPYPAEDLFWMLLQKRA